MGVACSQNKCLGDSDDKRLVKISAKSVISYQAFYYDKYGNVKARASTNYFDREIEDLEEIKTTGGVSNGVEYNFKSGAKYKGQWLNNMRHGFGRHTWPDGAAYEGEWRENLAAGKGRFLHSDGDLFIGQWKGNMANGCGSYYHKGSATYKGEWENDLQHGYGVENLVEGARFEGAFREGQKHGYGSYYWFDGSVYWGEWADNVINGHGMYLCSDGRCFKGQWQESAIHGVGRYTWPGGREYSGRYVSDQKQGFGVFKWQDGRKYEGYWKAGKQDGYGRYTLRDGTAKLAMWEEGRRVSEEEEGRRMEDANQQTSPGPRSLSVKPAIGAPASSDDNVGDDEAGITSKSLESSPATPHSMTDQRQLAISSRSLGSAPATPHSTTDQRQLAMSSRSLGSAPATPHSTTDQLQLAMSSRSLGSAPATPHSTTDQRQLAISSRSLTPHSMTARQVSAPASSPSTSGQRQVVITPKSLESAPAPPPPVQDGRKYEGEWRAGTQDGFGRYTPTKLAVVEESQRAVDLTQHSPPLVPGRLCRNELLGRSCTVVPRWRSCGSLPSSPSGSIVATTARHSTNGPFGGRPLDEAPVARSLSYTAPYGSSNFRRPITGSEATAEDVIRFGRQLISRFSSAQTLTPDATQARVCTVMEAASEAVRAEAAGRGKLPLMTVTARTREPEPEEQSGEVEELRRRLSEALRQNEALARRNLELEREHKRTEDVPCVPPPPPQQPPPSQQLLSAASRADISDPGASQPGTLASARLLAQSMTRIAPSFTAAGPRSVPVLAVASAMDSSENVSPRPTARVFRMAPAPAHSPRETAPRQASPARATAARMRPAAAAPGPAPAPGMAEAWSGPRRFLSAPLAALEAAAAAAATAHPAAAAVVQASATVLPAGSGAARSLSPPAKVAAAAAAQGPRLSRTATATTGPRVSCQRTASPLVPKARDNCSSTVGLASSLPSSLPSSAVLAPPTVPSAAAAAAWGQVRVVSVGGQDPAQSCMAPSAALWPAAAAAPSHASHAYRRTGSLEAVPLAAPAPVLGTGPFNSASPKLAQRESTWPEAAALPTVGTSEANTIGATQPGQPLKLRMGGPSASSSQL